jgi:hypothetical protein
VDGAVLAHASLPSAGRGDRNLPQLAHNNYDSPAPVDSRRRTRIDEFRRKIEVRLTEPRERRLKID